MKADTFWNGVELSSTFSKRGEKLTAIKDQLNLYHKAAATDKDKRLQELAKAIAIYAKAKNWDGQGPVGERDKNGKVKNTITDLIKQVDAHLVRSSSKSKIKERVQLLLKPMDAPTSTAAIEKARKDLDAAKGYASRDSQTFFSCIRGYQRGTNKQRNPAKPFTLHKDPYEKIYKGGGESGGGDMGGAVGGGDFRAALQRRGIQDQKGDNPFAWDANKVEETYKKVKDAGAGECTSFGSYGAYLLTNTGASTKPRVELVAWESVTKTPSKINPKITVVTTTTHVYCLVNRRGDYRQETSDTGAKRYRLPPVNEWNGDWWIVDPWAGAMGWDVIYEKATTYPYKTMMEPLYLQMVYEP